MLCIEIHKPIVNDALTYLVFITILLEWMFWYESLEMLDF